MTLLLVEKHKTNSGYKHNDKARFLFCLDVSHYVAAYIFRSDS